jgi:hypothetical protein
MRRIKARLAIACICAVATALFAGVALAGNGKDNAPGQVKQDGTAAQPAAQVEAQADASVSAAPSDHVAPGQAKQDAASTSSAPSNSTQANSNASSNTTSNGAVQQNGHANPAVAGMKPSSSTTSTKWTTCNPTGGTPSAATCPSTHGTAQAAVHSDASKRYGNSQTAAQIAVSRGGSGVKLTGPGNSQPHKVATCLHKSNPSGGVDVHAIKTGGYSSAACTATQTQQVLTSSVCGSKSVTTLTTTSQAALHGNGKQLGKGTAKHQVTSTSSSTVVTPTGEVCTTSSPGHVESSVSTVTPVTVVTPVTTAGSTVTPSNTGSVAGAQATLSTPKTQQAQQAPKATKAQHGVLGTVAKVSGSTLPFTGFPLWMALVVALGLIGAGLALRRRGSALRVQ